MDRQYLWKPHDAMSRAEQVRRTADVANAAALLVDAADNAPEGQREVATPYGTATVVRDGRGADVVLHDRDVTVHAGTDRRNAPAMTARAALPARSKMKHKDDYVAFSGGLKWRGRALRQQRASFTIFDLARVGVASL